MNIYADIVMSGTDFDPEYYMNKYNVYFRKYNKRGDYNERLKRHETEGYGILSINDNDTSEKVILKVISSYKLISSEVEKEISFREFNLIIESTQNSVTINSEYLALINDCFSDVNISFIEQ